MSKPYKYKVESVEIHRDPSGNHEATIVTMIVWYPDIKDTTARAVDVENTEGVLRSSFWVTAGNCVYIMFSLEDPNAKAKAIKPIIKQVGEVLNADLSDDNKTLTITITEHDKKGAYYSLMPQKDYDANRSYKPQ